MSMGHFVAGNDDSALLEIFPAIDSTAQALYPNNRVGTRIKKFLDAYSDIITIGALGIIIKEFNLGFSHPSIKPRKDGTVKLSAILYHVFRCGTVHEGRLDENARLVDGRHIKGDPPDKIELPRKIIFGLNLSVITNPLHKNITAELPWTVNIQGHHPTCMIPLAECWGQRDRLLELRELLKQVQPNEDDGPLD
ncbi:MAG: hypothetical protein ACF8GE_12355 [Phycisphaerales bacterium JB043]